MREAAFKKQRQDSWRQFEEILKTSSRRINPDTLADLFVKVSDDLAYARTYYADSQLTTYLNQLASRLHLAIYNNKRQEKGRFRRFWQIELPHLFYSAKNELALALVVFVVSMVLGAVSTEHDPHFPRLIMGDGYVNMTLENISKDDPMAVYKKAEQMNMFFAITINNVFVAFRAFAFGAISPILTLFLLFYNGIMVGAFQYFFHQQGLFLTSFLTIWIHGALEISAIVIAGSAGIVLGSSWLFPKTYTRYEAFRIGAKKGVKIIIGLVPVFIAAGFLEGFVTRLTEMPEILKWTIILTSFGFVIYYFGVYPYLLNRIEKYNEEKEIG